MYIVVSQGCDWLPSPTAKDARNLRRYLCQLLYKTAANAAGHQCWRPSCSIFLLLPKSSPKACWSERWLWQPVKLSRTLAAGKALAPYLARLLSIGWQLRLWRLSIIALVSSKTSSLLSRLVPRITSVCLPSSLSHHICMSLTIWEQKHAESLAASDEYKENGVVDSLYCILVYICMMSHE